MSLPYGNAGNRGHGLSDLVDLDAVVLHETDAALRINCEGMIAWVPKSQCEVNNDGTISMPEWLAKDKNFI